MLKILLLPRTNSRERLSPCGLPAVFYPNTQSRSGKDHLDRGLPVKTAIEGIIEGAVIAFGTGVAFSFLWGAYRLCEVSAAKSKSSKWLGFFKILGIALGVSAFLFYSLGAASKHDWTIASCCFFLLLVAGVLGGAEGYQMRKKP